MVVRGLCSMEEKRVGAQGIGNCIECCFCGFLFGWKMAEKNAKLVLLFLMLFDVGLTMFFNLERNSKQFPSKGDSTGWENRTPDLNGVNVTF